MAKRVLSIDIGLIKTKICEMDYGKKNPHVYRCITFDTPSNVIEDGYIRDMENFAIAMKEKIASAQIKVTDVVFTISSTKIANREVTVPLVKENRIQAVVDAGAQEYFPVDVSKYIISYNVLERINTKEERKLKLLLLAVPSNMIENYYEFAKMLDLHIVAMDYIGNSAFQIIKRQVGAGLNLSIQINEQTTMINVIDNEVLALQRTLSYGSMAVIDAVLENKVFGKSTESEAIAFLTKEKVINMQFDLRQEETAAALMSVEYSDGYNIVHRELEAKERVTDSLRYLVNNITRVIDYYNSKFPGKKIETLYITGPGAKFKGIDKLFHREIGLEVKPIDRLYSVQFAVGSIGNNEDQSEYMCAIGAGIQPVGFISKERIAKQEKKSNQFSMSVVFAMSVIASVFMIVVSTLIVNAAKDERKDLQARITSLREVEKQYNESQKVKEQYKAITAMELLTINQNQYLNDLLFQLEENLPSTMLVNSLAVTSTGVSMNIFATSKISVAELLIQLKQIDLLSNISIESIESKDNDMGISIYSFAVNCQYSNKALQAALAEQ